MLTSARCSLPSLDGSEHPLDARLPALEESEHPLAVNEHPLAVHFRPLAVNEHPLAVNEHPLAVNEHPLAVHFRPLAVNEHPLAVNEHPLDVCSIRSMVTNIRSLFTSINETPAISGLIRLFHASSRATRRQAGPLVACSHPRHVVPGAAPTRTSRGPRPEPTSRRPWQARRNVPSCRCTTPRDNSPKSAHDSDPKLCLGACWSNPSPVVLRAAMRQIERRTHEDVAFRVLAGGTHPDHSCISEFRRIHLKALSELFVQVLRLCRKAGLITLGHVALDGTKVQANASKHKAMSYERMKEQEQQLKAKVRDLLQQAESADAQEDTTYGVGRRGDELPKELQRAQSRLQRIRQAKAELEAEAKQERESSSHVADEDEKEEEDEGGSGGSSGGGTELPSHRVPTRADATPTAKAQRNFTDPDSRIMKSGNGFLQGYNAQLVVDSEAQVIVAHGVGNQPPDAEYLAPMVERTIANLGCIPAKMSADAGYFSDANVTRAYARGVEPFVATGRLKHGERPSCPRGRPPKGMSIKAQMARKLLTKRGRSVYARRKVIVEPVFGHIKEARGFRRFHLRGMGKVRGEWALVCIGHNLRKLHSAHLPVR